MDLEESIQKSIENMKGLKEGLNFFNSKWFFYEIGDNDELNQEQPAKWAIFPTFDAYSHYAGVYEMLHVGIWSGVPEEYKPILVMHELRESETDSHKDAREYEMEFAKRVLGEEGFGNYLEWRKQYDSNHTY